MSQQNKDPKALYRQAEAARKANNPEEAQQFYQEAIRSTDERTLERGESAILRTEKARSALKGRSTLFFLLPLLIAGIAFAIYRYIEHDFASKQAETDPKTFQFVEWLASRQTQQVISNIVSANPELSFDFSRATASSSMSPEEALQSLMRPGMQDRIRSQNESSTASSSGDGEGDGPARFVCSVDPNPACSAADQPSAPGERRADISMLVRSYRSVLDNERDCEKMEAAIDVIGQKIQWRKSEAEIKFELEQLAMSCYSRQKNHDKVIEQARKIQCSGDASAMNTGYWHLTASYYQQGRQADAQRMYTCFRETVQHLATYEFEPWRIAARHRESGALAWLYFNDLDTAVAELEAARNILKKASGGSSSLSAVAAEVDLDLMETYVTANIDPDTFSELHEDINTSGLLTDGYKQIKDTLAGIYYLQNRENKKSIVALENVATRFKHLPEYICSWDWSGFQRGLKDSISDPVAREYADKLVVATDCYVPQTIENRIQSVQEVLRWLRR
ncbi:tetratricopeptide repeat protein [Leucothrix pacifica]|uniref:Tetratricopeptide repeat protein n=1 Tax=Leucothrix pacifica TaxID=1247513 RepID=A0A317CMK2_9GAMM|nr:tetratricopeptide repeat protein [Leucothrix pacifica]PWQ99855.1 hypothetical protein DKW60_05115 [Leucothrix pacifica]